MSDVELEAGKRYLFRSCRGFSNTVYEVTVFETIILGGCRYVRIQRHSSGPIIWERYEDLGYFIGELPAVDVTPADIDRFKRMSQVEYPQLTVDETLKQMAESESYPHAVNEWRNETGLNELPPAPVEEQPVKLYVNKKLYDGMRAKYIAHIATIEEAIRKRNARIAELELRNKELFEANFHESYAALKDKQALK